MININKSLAITGLKYNYALKVLCRLSEYVIVSFLFIFKEILAFYFKILKNKFHR